MTELNFSPENKIALEFMARIAHAASKAYMLEAENMVVSKWNDMPEDSRDNLIQLAGAYMLNPQFTRAESADKKIQIIDRIFHSVVTEFVEATEEERSQGDS